MEYVSRYSHGMYLISQNSGIIGVFLILKIRGCNLHRYAGFGNTDTNRSYVGHRSSLFHRCKAGAKYSDKSTMSINEMMLY